MSPQLSTAITAFVNAALVLIAHFVGRFDGETITAIMGTVNAGLVILGLVWHQKSASA